MLQEKQIDKNWTMTTTMMTIIMKAKWGKIGFCLHSVVVTFSFACVESDTEKKKPKIMRFISIQFNSVHETIQILTLCVLFFSFCSGEHLLMSNGPCIFSQFAYLYNTPMILCDVLVFLNAFVSNSAFFHFSFFPTQPMQKWDKYWFDKKNWFVFLWHFQVW